MRVVDVLTLDFVIGDLDPLGVCIIGGLLVALLLDSLETLRLTVDVISRYRGDKIPNFLLLVWGKKLTDWEYREGAKPLPLYSLLASSVG
jgi:hypothetical protein